MLFLKGMSLIERVKLSVVIVVALILELCSAR